VEWKAASLGALDPVFQGRKSEVPGNLIATYFDGLERHTSRGVKFTPTCTRRDNTVKLTASCSDQMDGKGATPNGLYNHTAAVRDRRVLITDMERGVVMAVAMIDNPGTGPASTYMVPQLIKVENGAISRVESMVKWMPFGYKSAW
jgi:hypothetical protein